jgi:hypothetical protein
MTVAKTESLIREAIEVHLERLKADGLPSLQPVARSIYRRAHLSLRKILPFSFWPYNTTRSQLFERVFLEPPLRHVKRLRVPFHV